MTTFGSVCSGIEAASVAFGPLGWKAAWLSEIAAFPKAVLKQHFPKVPNLGDMTTIAARILAGEVEAPDLLCGGTPCQSFSVAGLRGSMDDDRGNLTLEFIRIADAIDAVRRTAGKPPVRVLYENVPGILSTPDNAFGAFLGGLCGSDAAIHSGAENGRWPSAGVVDGPGRLVVWRTLDAQFFGLAQRRRRVFVLALAGAGRWACADALLPVGDSMSRHPAPRRGARQGPPAGALRSTDGGSDVDHARAGHLALGGNNTSGPIDVATALLAKGAMRGDFESETFISHVPDVAHALRADGFDASEDGTGRGTPLIATAVRTNQQGANGHGIAEEVVHTLDSTAGNGQAIVFDTTQITSSTNRSNPQPGDPCHTLAKDAHPPAVAFSWQAGGKQTTLGYDPESDVCGTLHVGQLPAVAMPDVAYTTKLHNTAANNAGKVFEERATCLDAHSPPPALLTTSQVRRLTPVECERLQGFPDDWTRVPAWKGWRKMDRDETPESCAAEGLEVRANARTGQYRVKDVDGPRYKSIGNSWAVPVVRWIGRRLVEVGLCDGNL